jgi:hypothetical protein
MEYGRRGWRPAARVVAVALSLAVVPLPGLAADGPRPVATPTPLAASIEKASEAATLDAVQARPAAHADASTLETPSFFKSRLGIVVLGVFTAGVGYAAYSLSHDRIHSTNR